MISTSLEFQYFLDDKEAGHHKARKASIDYWRRLIEDITNEQIVQITYESERELIRVWFLNEKKKLTINIGMDSLQACTRDIIRQTHKWMENI